MIAVKGEMMMWQLIPVTAHWDLYQSIINRSMYSYLYMYICKQTLYTLNLIRWLFLETKHVLICTYYIAFIYQFNIYLYIHPSIHPSIHMSIHPSNHLSIYPYISVHPSINLSIHSSIKIFIHPSIHPSIN